MAKEASVRNGAPSPTAETESEAQARQREDGEGRDGLRHECRMENTDERLESPFFHQPWDGSRLTNPRPQSKAGTVAQKWNRSQAGS